jgi:hypothetical protein
MANGSGSSELAGKARYWTKQVEAWRRSGLSQVEFCQEHGLSRWGFLYWRRKLLDRSTGDLSFVQVANTSTLCSGLADAINIVVEERYRVEISDGFDGATLRRLLDVLEERRQL